MTIKQNFFNDLVNAADFIDLSGYGCKSTACNLARVFLAEKGWYIDRVGMVPAIQDWLQGLPSSCNFPFMNHDILTQYQDYVGKVLTEKAADKLLDEYFPRLAQALYKRIQKDIKRVYPAYIALGGKSGAVTVHCYNHGRDMYGNGTACFDVTVKDSEGNVTYTASSKRREQVGYRGTHESAIQHLINAGFVVDTSKATSYDFHDSAEYPVSFKTW